MDERTERNVAADVVVGVAVAAGVPLSELPVVLNIDVRDGIARGGASMRDGERTVTFSAPPDWPNGWLTVVGAAVDAVPDERDRPYLRLGDVAIAAYSGVLLLPNERMQVSVRWPSGQDTTKIISVAGATDADRRAAGQAARWLEALPNGVGAPSESTAAVRAQYLDAARRIVGRGDTLSRDSLADETGLTSEWTYKRMTKNGVTLRRLKRALREN